MGNFSLTGRPPFAAEDYKDLLEKNKKGYISYKGRHWSHLSADGNSDEWFECY